MTTDETIRKSCARSLRYLEDHQSTDGLWRDFHTLAGASSDWVSGFVTYAIACTNWRHPSVLTACKALLYRQRPNGGWSYSSAVPTDCDSTAWVLLALSMGPMWRPSTIQHGLRFLVDHQVEPTAGFATYAARDGIERFIELPETLTEGWRRPHPCVTAVTIHALLVHGERPSSTLIRKATAYLESERDVNGTWWSIGGRGTRTVPTMLSERSPWPHQDTGRTPISPSRSSWPNRARMVAGTTVAGMKARRLPQHLRFLRSCWEREMRRWSRRPGA